MGESSNFSSLLALANSHLSKTQLSKKETQLESTTTPSTSEIIMKPLKPKQASSIPNLMPSTSSISDVLSRQISNMLKRKEEEELKKQEELRKKEEEKKKLTEKMEDLTLEEEDDYVVDLLKAIETPYVYEPQSPPKKELSNSSSFESLFEQEKKFEKPKTPPIILPCSTDISYILKQKVSKGKCSAFGKVLISRIKPVAAPYIIERYNTVKPFDFKTKSPCDLILEERSRPSRYNAYDYDIMKRIMGDYDKKETK